MMQAINTQPYGQAGISAGEKPAPSLSAYLSQTAEALSKAEEALRSALIRLRGPRPEAVHTGVEGGPQGPLVITERAAANLGLAHAVLGMAADLMNRLND